MTTLVLPRQHPPRRRRITRAHLIDTALLTLAIGALVGATSIGVWVSRANYHDHVAQCTVTAVQAARIYTTPCGPLDNTAPLLVYKQQTATQIQTALIPGHTYRLDVVGWRQPALNQVPIIVAVYGPVTNPDVP